MPSVRRTPAEPVPTTASEVVDRLTAATDDAELTRLRRRLPAGEPALGVRMGTLFAIAETAVDLPLAEVERLLAQPTYEARMAAFCVLDFAARRGPSTALRDLYLRHHDRITVWDMVDRAAPRVVGATLDGGPFDLLDDLAGSPDPLRRRTAMTAPLWFTRSGDAAGLEAGFALAERLRADADPVVHKPVGIFLAHAGKKQPGRLAAFLAAFADDLPTAARRQATRLLPAPG